MRLKTVSTLTGAMLRTVRADIGANDGLPREYTVFFSDRQGMWVAMQSYAITQDHKLTRKFTKSEAIDYVLTRQSANGYHCMRVSDGQDVEIFVTLPTMRAKIN